MAAAGAASRRPRATQKLPRLNEIEIKSETCLTCRGERRRRGPHRPLPALLHPHPAARPWGDAGVPGTPTPLPVPAGCCPCAAASPAKRRPRFLCFQWFLPGASMINTSKGCFALLNNIICLTASLIESWQCLFVQVGFIVTSLSYFDYFCGLLVFFNPGSALQQGWAGKAAADEREAGPFF